MPQAVPVSTCQRIGYQTSYGTHISPLLHRGASCSKPLFYKLVRVPGKIV